LLQQLDAEIGQVLNVLLFVPVQKDTLLHFHTADECFLVSHQASALLPQDLIELLLPFLEQQLREQRESFYFLFLTLLALKVLSFVHDLFGLALALDCAENG
jgi:hypothetical protein